MHHLVNIYILVFRKIIPLPTRGECLIVILKIDPFSFGIENFYHIMDQLLLKGFEKVFDCLSPNMLSYSNNAFISNQIYLILIKRKSKLN